MRFELADEYTDPESERSVLRAILHDAELYWELDLPPEVFAEHRDAYDAVRSAYEADEAPPEGILGDTTEDASTGALEATDVHALSGELKDLWQRRQLSELQQDTAAAVGSDAPASEVVEALVERAAQIEAALSRDTAGRLTFPSDLVPDMLRTVETAREAFQANGDHVTGVRSGLNRLDEILGGFQAGLTILSGGPGTGKTTLALQMGADAAESGTPVLYVTFENSPESLTLKGVCACGGLNSRDVRRGRLPLSDVRPAAARWQKKAKRLAVIEGRPDLTRGQIRGKARRLMNRFGADRCLIVVDYLQLYAKAAEDLRHLRSLREKVEVMGNGLRDLGMRLRSPVLALASQHRGAGYGSGGSASLDTLKESGDLEYSADAVAFLTEPEDRMETEPARALDLTVSKNRHGETGKLNLIFRPDVGKMRPEANREDPREMGDGSTDGTPWGNASPF